MGIDDNTPTKHLNIKDYAEHVDKIVGTMPQWMDDRLRSEKEKANQMNNITFHSKDAQILLTITREGRLVLGPGISKEKATQEVAELLVKQFQQLIPDAESPPRLVGYIANEHLKFLQTEGSYREATISKHERPDCTPVYVFDK